MEIIYDKSELRQWVKNTRRQAKTIGLVPTMGYLHEGHLSLIRRARRENDRVVVSVFVNPTQFGPGEDLDQYPRNTRRDIELMGKEQVDVAFSPSAESLYPPGYTTYVQVEGNMTQTLCGRTRPHHFKGVTTIVAKLFHLVAPHRAYFGQKDAQQVTVIQQMVRDLDFDLQIVVCPTVRETDGLAMSSRNAYLTARERADAAALSQSLHEAQQLIEHGERRSKIVIQSIRERFAEIKDAQIDYISIVNAHTLEEQEEIRGEVLIALAVKLGRTRLIDNIRISAPRAQ